MAHICTGSGGPRTGWNHIKYNPMKAILKDLAFPACGLLIGIILVGLAVRLIYIFQSERLQRDEISYIMLARSLEEKKEPDYSAEQLKIPPLIFLGIGEIHRLTGWDYRICGLVWGLLFYPLLPLGVYWLTETLWESRRLALTASAMAAFYPDTLWLGGEILRDGPYIALFLLTAAAILKATASGKYAWLPVAALAAGIAQGWRKEAPELIVIVLVGMLFLWWELLWKNRPFDEKRLYRLVWASFAGVLLFVGIVRGEYVWSAHRGFLWRNAVISIGGSGAGIGTDD